MKNYKKIIKKIVKDFIFKIKLSLFKNLKEINKIKLSLFKNYEKIQNLFDKKSKPKQQEHTIVRLKWSEIEKMTIDELEIYLNHNFKINQQ